MFKKINIQNWRQFENIDIEFDSRLTILTGANGAGKTTLLNILNQHFGWNFNFVSTPERDKEKGILKYLPGFISNLFNKDTNRNKYADRTIIGNILYTDSNNICDITVPNNVSNTFNAQLVNCTQVQGLYIPSHRSIFNYSAVSSIPTCQLERDQIFNTYTNIIRNKYNNNYEPKTQTSSIKETLISLATFGYGNVAVMPNSNAIKMFEDFQTILRIMLPPKLQFEKILIEVPEVILVTKTGSFPIDAVSGGIAAIIDLVWEIFMFSEPNRKFVVTLDEPENHLHPEMQRALLTNLLKAFPSVQFIVATHNPFIITSVPDSNVYVLNYNENNKVISTKLDTVNKAGSSNDILRDVLGLPTTMPIWAEQKLNDIVEMFIDKDINEDSLNLLRKEMGEIGLEKLIPDTIAKVVRGEIKK